MIDYVSVSVHVGSEDAKTLEKIFPGAWLFKKWPAMPGRASANAMEP